jgi:hypothetical protein
MRKLTLVEGAEAPTEREEERHRLPGIPATLDFTGTSETSESWKDKLAHAEQELRAARGQEIHAFILRRSRPGQRRP